MQALTDFKGDSEEAVVGNEDMQEEIKDMLKNFHSNLLVLQQVVQVGGHRAHSYTHHYCLVPSLKTISIKR